MAIKMIRRDIETDILRWLDDKEIIAIRGPRQCGKTTFLNMIADILKRRKVKQENIHYISFEDDMEKEKFEKNSKDYISYRLRGKGKHYLLLDEVQYIRNAGKALKQVFDLVDNIKIIITGSSTLDLNNIGPFLVGRVLLFEMYPFSFKEFLRAKDEKMHDYYISKRISLTDKSVKEENIILLEDLNTLMQEYITYGGYPAVVLEKDMEKKKILLRNLFQTYVEKDVVKTYGSRYRQRITGLIRYLSSLNGAMINYNEISSVTSLYDKEVKEMLCILEDTYVIRLLKPFHRNLSTELRKNPKVYFVDTGLRNSIAGRFVFGDAEYGKLLENYLLNRFRKRKANYWRTTAKAEMDLIIDEKIPIESKIYPKITRSFRSFIKTYKPETAFLVNMDKLYMDEAEDTKVMVVPFALM